MAVSDLFEVLAQLNFTLVWLLVLCGLMLVGQIATLALIHSMRQEIRRAISPRKGTST